MPISGMHSGLGSVADFGIEFNDQWEDLQGPVVQANQGTSLLTKEQYRDTPMLAWFMQHNQNDAVYYTYQLRHAWKLHSSVSLHCHVTPMSTWVPGVASKNVYWEISYFWSTTGLEIPVATSWTTVNVTSVIYPTDQFKNKIYNLVTISPPATAKESSLILVKITRLGSSINDTYTDDKVGGTGAANLAVWDFDVHYQLDKPGTIEMLPT